MILSKSKLKLLLFSILTLAIISCGDQSKAKTTSVKVSIDVPNSISRGVLGTYPDITDIILDISDANGKYYAKGRQFTKVTDGVDFVWTTTVDNVPVNLDLNFTASAYDINETKIFKGLTGKTLTLQSAAVFINLFPISDGNAPSIPEITSVSPVSDGVLLHIEDDVSDKVQYQVSPDNFKNSTGTVIIDASGKGTIHLINKDGLFSNIPIYNITLNNHIGGVLETTFAYRQSSDANITIGIAPTVNGIKFKKIGDDKLQAELNVSDDKDISDLSYSWSFNGNSDINIENNAINPIIINNFNDSIEGTLITIVTDKHNLTYTHEYNITANQFKADIEFKVSSTSVDDNKIFVNESIDIIFSKEIREGEISTNSININDGIKSVPGSFTFPSTNKKKVVFTPSEQWKTTKSYNLNITAKVLDSDGHRLIPVVVEFSAQIPIDKRSCKAILESNPNSDDGTYSIDPDGAGGNDAFDVYCDMSTDGGGWTYVTTAPLMKRFFISSQGYIPSVSATSTINKHFKIAYYVQSSHRSPNVATLTLDTTLARKMEINEVTATCFRYGYYQESTRVYYGDSGQYSNPASCAWCSSGWPNWGNHSTTTHNIGTSKLWQLKLVQNSAHGTNAACTNFKMR